MYLRYSALRPVTWIAVLLIGAAGTGLPAFGQNSAGAPLILAQSDQVEIEFWNSVKDTKSLEELEAYLEAYPNGKFAPLARLRISKLGKLQDKPAERRSRAKVDASGMSGTGAYQAAKSAEQKFDYSAALRFYLRALELEPNNTRLVSTTLLVAVVADDWLHAEKLAKDLVRLGGRSRIAQMVLAVGAFRTDKFARAIEHFKAAQQGPIGTLTGRLATAWTRAANGQSKRALSVLDIKDQPAWADFYISYHRALLADVFRQRRLARKSYGELLKRNSGTPRLITAYMRHAGTTGNAKLVKEIEAAHRTTQKTNVAHPLVAALLADIEQGRKIDLLVTTPRMGLAEVFYGLGEALLSEGGTRLGMTYLQFALRLEPRHTFALAALANGFEQAKRFDKANETYSRIKWDTPLRVSIDVRRARNLNALDRIDDAVRLLKDVAARAPENFEPFKTLGDLMRGRNRYAEAAAAYTQAIALLGKPAPWHWALYYSRGVSLERVKDWASAEKDLRKAIALNPEQPLALNYLGYTLVDRDQNLDEGLRLIQRAVKLKPKDRYLIDSLGWAYYKKGQFKRAIKYLEQANTSKPYDATMLSHLGDAYWKVDRKKDARRTWRRALDADPGDEWKAKLHARLAHGLEQAERTTIKPQGQKPADDLKDLDTLDK